MKKGSKVKFKGRPDIPTEIVGYAGTIIEDYGPTGIYRFSVHIDGDPAAETWGAQIDDLEEM